MLKTGIFFIFLITLAGGAFFFLNQEKPPVTPQTPTPMNALAPEKMTDSQEAGKTTETTQPSQKYQEYSASQFTEQGTGRRVLFFYANWCPTCQPADAELQQKQAEFPDDLSVIRVNYNDNATDESEKALAQKYGITYQHTFVQIDETGAEVTKWNGGKYNELLKNLK